MGESDPDSQRASRRPGGRPAAQSQALILVLRVGRDLAAEPVRRDERLRAPRIVELDLGDDQPASAHRRRRRARSDGRPRRVGCAGPSRPERPRSRATAPRTGLAQLDLSLVAHQPRARLHRQRAALAATADARLRPVLADGQVALLDPLRRCRERLARRLRHQPLALDLHSGTRSGAGQDGAVGDVQALGRRVDLDVTAHDHAARRS